VRRPYFWRFAAESRRRKGGQGRARRSGVVVDVFADERSGPDDGEDGEEDVLWWLRATSGGALTQRYHSFSVHYIHLPPTLTRSNLFPFLSQSSTSHLKR
jgi:hypothetical protein